MWRREGRVDHDITRLVSGIADTALNTAVAAQQAFELIKQLFRVSTGGGGGGGASGGAAPAAAAVAGPAAAK